MYHSLLGQPGNSHCCGLQSDENQLFTTDIVRDEQGLICKSYIQNYNVVHVPFIVGIISISALVLLDYPMDLTIVIVHSVQQLCS